MLVDLLHITTRDGVRLDGVYQAPATPSSLLIDGAILVHGTGSNFYGSTLFDALADRLVSLGVGVLRVNTRGHDLMSTASTARGGRRLGAAYEVVDDCRHDLAAWVDRLQGLSGSRVGLDLACCERQVPSNSSRSMRRHYAHACVRHSSPFPNLHESGPIWAPGGQRRGDPTA